MDKLFKGKVSMSKKSFTKEHTELVKILKSGNKKGIKKEIREQSEELKKVKKRK